jgi:AbrB family looped-hinge helix DNA binding protein
MNMLTRISEKGQVVVPKPLRDQKGWWPGTDLEVVDVGDGVLLRPLRRSKTLTVEEATARLRQLYVHQGPPVPLEELSFAAAKGAAERDRRTR